MAEEIKRMIEEKLGYSFKLWELPPSLRAKINDLAKDLYALDKMEREYYTRRSDLEDYMRKRKEEVERRYDQEIRDCEAEIEKLRLSKIVGSAFGSLLVFIIIFIPISLVVLAGVTSGRPTETQAIIAFVIPLTLGLILFIGDTVSNVNKRRRYERKVKELKNRKIDDLSTLEREYSELRERQDVILERVRREIDSLEQKFKADLSQVSLEVDSALNAIFQTKMDFSFLRSKGLIIEKIACPHCGGEIKLPESGHVTQCRYCGRSVYAVDVFKELKRGKRT
ncbi:MAG: hypothetical protein QXP80_06825 [Zestosphaera sp.]